MKVEKTDRGFGIIRHEVYPPEQIESGFETARLVQCSSAIAPDFPGDDIPYPGSSYLWVGNQHHLNRQEVAELRDALTRWLETGKLSGQARPDRGGEGATTSDKNLTVADVRALCDKAGVAWAVLVAEAGPHTQWITWGRSPEAKVYASDLAQHLSTEVLGLETVAVRESFKLDAARNKARVEELEAEVKRLQLELQEKQDLLDNIADEGMDRNLME